jgi:hypothetical protein
MASWPDAIDYSLSLRQASLHSFLQYCVVVVTCEGEADSKYLRVLERKKVETSKCNKTGIEEE